MWDGQVFQSDSEDEGGETESQKSGSSYVSTEKLQKLQRGTKMCKNLVELLGAGAPERPDSAA
jgi:hypothetical protein